MKEGLVGLRVQVGLIILGCSFFWNLGIPFWYHTLDGLNQTDAGLRAHAPIPNNTSHRDMFIYVHNYLPTYIHTKIYLGLGSTSGTLRPKCILYYSARTFLP